MTSVNRKCLAVSIIILMMSYLRTNAPLASVRA
jgi:hypothetical protein